MTLLKRVEIEETGGFVEALDSYGTDATFYRIARVCTGKGFHDATDDDDKRADFIARLIRLKHLRPFEFGGIVVGIRCPIYVERQLRTYRKPDMERSLRFCDPIEIAGVGTPTTAQGAELIKAQTGGNREGVEGEISRHGRFSVYMYNVLREDGCRREEARRVLTLDTLTEVASFYTVRSLFHVFDERLSSAAQSETRKYVAALLEIARELFPQTIAAYENGRKGGDK